jgi:ribosome-binding protein aMBF1 (putative translation factor)
MFWFGKPSNRAKSKIENLCHVCGENQLPENPAVLRLKVQDGIAEMNVCDDCADFFDKSAEVLAHRGKGNKKDEPV